MAFLMLFLAALFAFTSAAYAPPPLPTQDPYPDCKDGFSYCSSYKAYCQDTNYVSYLQKYCKRTCNYCHITTLPPPTTKPATTKFWTLPSESGNLQPGCGKKGPGHTRIVGGTAAKPGDWPWIVTFDYKYNTGNPGHQCGGTLITDEWILSAAHCFYDDKDKSNYWLTIGEHDLKTDSGHEQKIPIADLIFHPDYNPSNYDNDLALVKLSRKATINDRVKTACLPDQNTTFSNGTKCVIAGWGLLEQYGRGPQILQQAQVPLIERSVCKAAFPHHLVSNNMICAGYAAGGIDSCQGDSGGPLVCKRDDDTWFLWGVVSWGVGCGRKGKYGVYARTQVLRRWVDQVVFTNN
eukprot:gene2651-850_t